MNAYLVQHAEATSKDVDPERPLTDKGRKDAEHVAALAAELGVEVYEIRHSTKTRAAETAEIMAAALSPARGVREVPGLSPLDDVQPVARQLTEASQPLMLVGHLPFMERIAGQLVVGDADRPVVEFHKGGIVCLVREGEQWQVSWIVTPEIARV